MLNGEVRRQRSQKRSSSSSTSNPARVGHEDKENQVPKSKADVEENGKGKEGDRGDDESGRMTEKQTKAERILRFPRRRKSCVLTDGFVPLLQTDRLAIENIGKLLSLSSGIDTMKLMGSPDVYQIQVDQSVSYHPRIDT